MARGAGELTRRRRCVGSDSSISPTVADKRSTSMPTPDSLQRVLVSAHGIAGPRLLLPRLPMVRVETAPARDDA